MATPQQRRLRRWGEVRQVIYDGSGDTSTFVRMESSAITGLMKLQLAEGSSETMEIAEGRIANWLAAAETQSRTRAPSTTGHTKIPSESKHSPSVGPKLQPSSSSSSSPVSRPLTSGSTTRPLTLVVSVDPSPSDLYNNAIVVYAIVCNIGTLRRVGTEAHRQLQEVAANMDTNKSRLLIDLLSDLPVRLEECKAVVRTTLRSAAEGRQIKHQGAGYAEVLYAVLTSLVSESREYLMQTSSSSHAHSSFLVASVYFWLTHTGCSEKVLQSVAGLHQSHINSFAIEFLDRGGAAVQSAVRLYLAGAALAASPPSTDSATRNYLADPLLPLLAMVVMHSPSYATKCGYIRTSAVIERIVIENILHSSTSAATWSSAHVARSYLYMLLAPASIASLDLFQCIAKKHTIVSP